MDCDFSNVPAKGWHCEMKNYLLKSDLSEPISISCTRNPDDLWSDENSRHTQ